MANETIEIYLNSKSASNYLNNQISDCFYNLPSIEILQDEIVYKFKGCCYSIFFF